MAETHRGGQEPSSDVEPFEEENKAPTSGIIELKKHNEVRISLNVCPVVHVWSYSVTM